MPNSPGSPDKDQSARAAKPLSDIEAADVKGGGASASPVTSPKSPIFKPIIPRFAEPCI